VIFDSRLHHTAPSAAVVILVAAGLGGIGVPALADSSAPQPPAPAATAGCQANLTCVRQNRVTSAKDFTLHVPDLSQWQRLDGEVVDPPSTQPASLSDPALGLEMVLIPGACYLTEASSPAGQRRVCVDPLWVGVHEVTFEQYDRFVEATARKRPEDEGFGRGSRPAINVNVYDALDFARWLSRQTGVRYRLPTEVEWEHAARAGSTTTFPWGDELGVNRANCDGCGSRWDGVSTAPVGSFPPNAWGLHDVIGNVGEWTCSVRDPDPARSYESCDGPYESRRRVYRNGGWSDAPDRLGASFRDWNAGMRRTDFVGFRLVRECPECRRQPEVVEAGPLSARGGESDR
jgi:formylglycine-generating enzyme required for sulfatase activity